MKLEFADVISTDHKFEGLTLYKRDGKKFLFYYVKIPIQIHMKALSIN